MDKPLARWYCDVCNEVIDDAKKGYVIWKSSKAKKYHGFKIIHQVRCDLDDHIASNALQDFLGERGAAYLLSFLSGGSLLARIGQSSRSVSDLDEFVDLFRRCQTPYYEEARRKFADPDVREDFGDRNEYAPYLPETLKHIIENYPKE